MSCIIKVVDEVGNRWFVNEAFFENALMNVKKVIPKKYMYRFESRIDRELQHDCDRNW